MRAKCSRGSDVLTTQALGNILFHTPDQMHSVIYQFIFLPTTKKHQEEEEQPTLTRYWKQGLQCCTDSFRATNSNSSFHGNKTEHGKIGREREKEMEKQENGMKKGGYLVPGFAVHVLKDVFFFFFYHITFIYLFLYLSTYLFVLFHYQSCHLSICFVFTQFTSCYLQY